MKIRQLDGLKLVPRGVVDIQLTMASRTERSTFKFLVHLVPETVSLDIKMACVRDASSGASYLENATDDMAGRL